MAKTNREIPNALMLIMNDLSRRDMRIGQMFDNLFCYIRSKGTDPFYVENDKLVEWFLEYLNESGINPFRPDE